MIDNRLYVYVVSWIFPNSLRLALNGENNNIKNCNPVAIKVTGFYLFYRGVIQRLVVARYAFVSLLLGMPLKPI